jgi:hypothetical protein
LSDDNKLRFWGGFMVVLGFLLYWGGAFHSTNWAYLVLGLLILYGLGLIGMSLDKLVDLVENLEKKLPIPDETVQQIHDALDGMNHYERNEVIRNIKKGKFT